MSLRYRKNDQGRTLLDDIRQFVADGKHVLGICNGFQVLVKLGLLPDLSGTVTPEVTLTHNASGRYEDRWVKLKVNPQSNTPFLKGLTYAGGARAPRRRPPHHSGRGHARRHRVPRPELPHLRRLRRRAHRHVPLQPQRCRPQLRRPYRHHRPRIRPDAPSGGVPVALQPPRLGPAQAPEPGAERGRRRSVAVSEYRGTHPRPAGCHDRRAPGSPPVFILETP